MNQCALFWISSGSVFGCLGFSLPYIAREEDHVVSCGASSRLNLKLVDLASEKWWQLLGGFCEECVILSSQ